MILGPNANKQKARTAQCPFLEHFLTLWIDAAEYARVPVTDDIIRAQATIIQRQLKNAGIDEGYDSFEMSGGWLFNFKGRFNIGRLRRHGEAGKIDKATLPGFRTQLAEKLAPFAPRDGYNCDESGLVYNKQPTTSNVRKEKGKTISGSGDHKTRISTFHIVNQDGSDKRKIWVIGRAKEPHAFKHARVNKANLPVIYRYNKKAWMLVGIWYEFLRALDTEMRISGRHIALVTDNCPTHPHPECPPANFTGVHPGPLTNVTMIYLPPNTTSHLQPLDQGIIKSFKAAYRRQYAEHMVQHFNVHGVAPQKIDILQAIHMIADAWDAVSVSTIVHCWRKADICPSPSVVSTGVNPHLHQPSSEDQLQYFIASQRTHCQVLFRQVLKPVSDPDFIAAFEEFFTFDEDQEEGDDSTELPDAAQIVQEGIAAGVLMRNPQDLDLSDVEDSETTPEQLPIMTTDHAIQSVDGLARYLQSLKVSHLESHGGKQIEVSQMVTHAMRLHIALLQ